jgi:hypothetical protein
VGVGEHESAQRVVRSLQSFGILGIDRRDNWHSGVVVDSPVNLVSWLSNSRCNRRAARDHRADSRATERRSRLSGMALGRQEKEVP